MSEKQVMQCPYCNIVEAKEVCVLKTVHNEIDGKEIIFCCEALKNKIT